MASEPKSPVAGASMRHFVAGNLWMFVAMALAVGRRLERGAPTRYSFMGLGNWFTPFEYGALLVAALGLGLAFLRASRKRNGE